MRALLTQHVWRSCPSDGYSVTWKEDHKAIQTINGKHEMHRRNQLKLRRIPPGEIDGMAGAPRLKGPHPTQLVPLFQ